MAWWGLIKPFLPWIIGAVLSGLALYGIYDWRNDFAKEAVEDARAESSAQAIVLETERVAVQDEQARRELSVLRGELRAIQSEQASFRQLLEQDWDRRLQNDPEDFVDRARRATAEQLQRAQESLDADHSPAGRL